LNEGNVSLCFLRFFQVPFIEKWSQFCNIYINIPLAGFHSGSNFDKRDTERATNLNQMIGQLIPISVLTGQYVVAVSLSTGSATVTVEYSGINCTTTSEVPPICDIVVFEPYESAILIQPGEIKYFTANVGPLANEIIFDYNFGQNEKRSVSQTLDVCAAQGALPTTNCGSSVNILEPDLGDWYFSVTTVEAVTFSATFTENLCTDPEIRGPKCDVEVDSVPRNGVSFESYTLDSILTYFHTNDSQEFSISLHSVSNVEFYVRYGQLPSKDKYDYLGCSNQNCAVYNIVPFVKGDWYIGVAGGVAYYFNIWADTVCANNCTERGTCNYEGSDQGLCSCEGSYEGYDCSIFIDVLPTYAIILIVLAGLNIVLLAIAITLFLRRRYKRQYIHI